MTVTDAMKSGPIIGDGIPLADKDLPPAALAAQALIVPSEASAQAFLKGLAGRPEAEQKAALDALLAGLGKSPAAERALTGLMKNVFAGKQQLDPPVSAETKKLLKPFLQAADTKIAAAEKAEKARLAATDLRDSKPTGVASADKPAVADGLRSAKLTEADHVAGSIANRCQGYTSAAQETAIANDIKAFVGTGPGATDRARVLLDRLKAQTPAVDLARIVNELENPAERSSVLDLLLPASSPDEKAGAIAEITGNWFWQFLMALFGFKDDRATVHQIVRSSFDKSEPDGVGPKSAEELRKLFDAGLKKGVDFETIYDALPEDQKTRQTIVLASANAMTVPQRAHAIAVLVRGYTPEEKERVIGIFLAKSPPTERKALMETLQKEQKISYGDVEGELGKDDRAFLVSHYLRPESIAKFRAEKLPVNESEFEGLRARSITSEADIVLGDLEAHTADLPVSTLKTAVPILSSAPSESKDAMAARAAELKRITDQLTDAAGILEGKVAAGTAKLAAVDAKIGEYDAITARCKALIAKNPGSDPQAVLIREDATRIMAFVADESARLVRTKTALEGELGTVGAAAKVARSELGTLAGVLSGGQALLEKRASLRAGTADQMERFKAGDATANPFDTKAYETHATALKTHLEELHAYRTKLLKLQDTDPKGFEALEATGAIAVLNAEIAATQAELSGTVKDARDMHATQRWAAEVKATQTFAKANGFVDAAGAKLETATDAELEKLTAAHDAPIAALKTEIAELKKARDDANAVLAKYKGRDESTLTMPELMEKMRAVMTLGGCVLTQQGKSEMSLDDRIKALEAALRRAELSKSVFATRRTSLAEGLEAKLVNAAHPTVENEFRPGTDDDLWKKMSALSDMYGIPVPDKPKAGEPFKVTYDRVGDFLRKTESAQAGSYMMMCTLLKNDFGVDAGVTWVQDGDTKRPELPRVGGQPPPAPVDWKKFETENARIRSLLAKALGVPESTLTDPKSILSLAKLARRDDDASKVESPLLTAYAKVQSNRAALPRAYIEILSQTVGTSYAGTISLGDLEKLSNDLNQPIGVREAARVILKNPELKKALGVPPAEGITKTKLDALEARAKGIYVPGPQGQKAILARQIPVGIFYAEADADARTLKAKLKNGDFVDVARFLGGLTYNQRQMVMIEYAAQNGQEALNKDMTDAFGGERLGWALALLDRRETADTAKFYENLITYDPKGVQSKTWPDSPSFGELRGKKITPEDYEKWSGNLQFTTFDNYLDLYDKQFRGGFSGIVYGVSGTRPPDVLIDKLKTHLGEAKTAFAKYTELNDAAAAKEKEALALNQSGKDPARAEALLAEAAKLKADAEPYKKSACTALAQADWVLDLMKSGSKQGTDKWMAIAKTTYEISKSVAISAAAAAMTLTVIGAPGGAAAGTAAAASWGTVVTGVLAGTAVGTTVAFGFALNEERMESGPFSWGRVGDKTAKGGGEAFLSALTAGIPLASMHKMGALAMQGNKFAATMMNSVVIRSTFMATLSAGSTMVGTGAQWGIHKAIGDEEGAKHIKDSILEGGARAFVGALIMAPWAHKVTGAVGAGVNAGFGATEQAAVNWLKGRPWHEGLAQAAVSSAVMGLVFEASNHMMVARQIKNAKPGEGMLMRLPGEKATVEPSWRISEVRSDGKIILTKEGSKPETVMAAQLVASNKPLERIIQDSEARALQKPDPAFERLKAMVKPGDVVTLTDKAGVRFKGTVIGHDEAGGVIIERGTGTAAVRETYSLGRVAEALQLVPPVGLESGLVPGVDNAIGGKGKIVAAVDKAIAEGRQVSLATVEAQRFKFVGNVGGDHAVGNAYISAYGRQLEAYLRAAGITDVTIIHHGGKSFRILYTGSDHPAFLKAMQGLTEGKSAQAFKQAVYEDTKSQLTTSQAKKLKPPDEINLYVGVATEPATGAPKLPALEAAQQLYDRSYEAAKVAQLDNPGLTSKTPPAERDALLQQGKLAKKDSFAVYDPVAVERLRGMNDAFRAELDMGKSGKFTAIHERLAQVGGDPWRLTQGEREQLFLSQGMEALPDGRRVIDPKFIPDLMRKIGDDLASGRAKGEFHEFASPTGDEIFIARVEKNPTTGAMELRFYSIDINDFGAANSALGTRGADEVKAKVLVELKEAAKTSDKPLSELMRDIGVRITSEVLADPAYALKGKVEPSDVSGFRQSWSLREGTNFELGATGTLKIGGADYKATVVKDPGGKGLKMQVERNGRTMLVDFTATGGAKAKKQLALILPDNRTTLSMGGFKLTATDLEPANADHGTRLRSETIAKDAPELAKAIAEANKRTKNPNYEGFIAALTDAYAEHLKSHGKAAAIADGSGKYSPGKFVGELDLATIAKDPTFRAEFNKLIKEVYARSERRGALSPELASVVDQYRVDVQTKTWSDSLDPAKPMGGLDAAAQAKVPQTVADLTGAPILKPEAVKADADVRTVAPPPEGPPKPGQDGAAQYKKFMAEVRGAQLLAERGLGPKVLGIVDHGNGKLSYVLDTAPANMKPPYEQMPYMRDPVTVRGTFEALSALHDAGLDIRGPLNIKVGTDGKVFFDPASIVPLDPARPSSIAGHLRTLRLQTFGEPLVAEMSPANARDGLAARVSTLPETQRAAVEAQLGKTPADTNVSIVKDPSGKVWVIEQRVDPDGGWQWTARGIDQRGAIGENVISERFSADGKRTAAARGEIDPSLTLIDLRDTLPPLAPEPTGAALKNKGDIAKIVKDGAAVLDRNLDSVKPGEIAGKAHEDSGRVLKKPEGGEFDHGHELRNARKGAANVLKLTQQKLDNPYLMAKLTPEERAYITSVRDRAKAMIELIDYALQGGAPPKGVVDGLAAHKATMILDQQTALKQLDTRLAAAESLPKLAGTPLEAPTKIAKALDLPLVSQDKGAVRFEPAGQNGYSEAHYASFAEQVAHAKLRADLGLGPKVLGICETKDGRLGIVMERTTPIEGQAVTPARIAEIKASIEALRAAGYALEGYTIVEGPNGKLLLDGGDLVGISKDAPPHNFGVDVMQLMVQRQGEVVRQPMSASVLGKELAEGSGWAKGLPEPQAKAVRYFLDHASSDVTVSIVKAKNGELIFVEAQKGRDGTVRMQQRTLGTEGSAREPVRFGFTADGKPVPPGEPFKVLSDDGTTMRVIGADGFEHEVKMRNPVQQGPPIDPAKLQTLSEAQVKEILKQFEAHVAKTSFNDAAPTLEFMAFYREAKKTNPALTITQAFAMFKPDGATMVNKYNGGNCFSLAENFAAQLKAQGIDSHMVGNVGYNAAVTIDGRIPRPEALGYIERAHGSLVIPYKTPSGEVRYLHIETGVGLQIPPEITPNIGTLADGHTPMSKYVDPERPMLNTDDVLKNRMRVLDEMTIINNNKKPKPGVSIDMMRGEMKLFNIEPGKKQVSIDFVTMMKAGETPRLIELLKMTQKELGLPDSFVQDTLTLMETRVTGEYQQLMLGDTKPQYDYYDAERGKGGGS